jgi:polysaccharide export outer membrane protein
MQWQQPSNKKEKHMSKRWLAILSALILYAFVIWDTTGIAQTETAVPESASSESTYNIGAGDILEITTWKEPDFSREEVLVRLDGMITFPLINDIQAKGQTPLAVKQTIENRLKKYVASPVVTVTVRSSASKRFYILGEVMSTGEYPLVKNLTVLQAFALAGGFSEWASKKEIILLRNEDGKEKIYRVNYRDIIKGRDFSQNIKLQADDTIIVP